MNKKNSHYKITLLKSKKKPVFISMHSYNVDRNSSKSREREVSIIFDDILYNNVEDGVYNARIELITPKNITVRRAYELKLSTNNIKELKYKLSFNKSIKKYLLDSKGKLQRNPPVEPIPIELISVEQIPIPVEPVTILDHTVYDVPLSCVGFT